MASIALCPASFDPITNGHLYVLERAADRFDTVIAAIGINPRKSGFFPVDERLELVREVTAHLSNVQVDTFTGLVVDYAKAVGAKTIVKGLRSSTDFEYELPMALMNRDLADVETVFTLSAPEYMHVSSSLIKEVSALGGDVAPFVPPAVLAAINDRVSSES